MVKYLVGLATQFRNKKCVTYLAGLLIIIFEKSPPGQLNCQVAKYFWGQSPNGSVIWPGQYLGTQEYISFTTFLLVFAIYKPSFCWN